MHEWGAAVLGDLRQYEQVVLAGLEMALSEHGSEAGEAIVLQRPGAVAPQVGFYVRIRAAQPVSHACGRCRVIEARVRSGGGVDHGNDACAAHGLSGSVPQRGEAVVEGLGGGERRHGKFHGYHRDARVPGEKA